MNPLHRDDANASFAADAGVHRYVDACLPVFAHEHFLAVHAAEGGERTIRLKTRARRVTDLLTGTTLATGTDSFRVRFATPDTKLFGVE